MSKSKENFGVIVLAAGLGTRMRSSLPKVLHEMGGKPLVVHILDQIKLVIPHASIAVVVGHGRELVEKKISEAKDLSQLDIHFIHQTEQKGTGHAARCAIESEWGEKQVQKKSSILILPGDAPLIPVEMLEQLALPFGRGEVVRLVTCEVQEPLGYGRIVRRGKSGPMIRIVEEKDATIREKEIREINTSMYMFQAGFLKFGLERLQNKNAQKEFYLTDLIAQAVRTKKKTDVLKWSNPNDLRGINDPWELAEARKILNERCLRNWALAGVNFLNPQSTWIDLTVQLGEDVTIGTGVVLLGTTKIHKGAIIGARVILKDVEVGEGAEIRSGTVAENATVHENASVGPYAHLRADTVIGAHSRIGNFVEIKKSQIGSHTNIAHLSYVGDAEIGNHVNVGCGFITCNFSGRTINGERKHKTVIEDGVFVGSDCQAIAPITIGKGSYIASGSTLTENVEPDSLAIARSRQVNKLQYAKKLRDSHE